MKSASLNRAFAAVLCLCMMLMNIQPVSASPKKNLSISGKVWHDENGNGKMDAGEKGVKGISISSYFGNGNKYTALAISAEDGSYSVTAGNPGNDNVIKVDLAALKKAGYEPTTNKYVSMSYGSKINPYSGETGKMEPSKNINIGLKRINVNNEDKNDSISSISAARTADKKTIYQGESVKVTYSITPKPVKPAQGGVKKDIVLVLDTSGSMNDNSKMAQAKSVAKNFIDKFSQTDNVRIGIVEYSTYGRKASEFKSVKSNMASIKSDIDKLGTGGATNIGDGVRIACAMLDGYSQADEKYIILMTDGEATAYSRDINGKKSSSSRSGVYNKDGSYKEKSWDLKDDYMGNHINTEMYHEYLKDGRKTGFYIDEYISYLGKQEGIDAAALQYAREVAKQKIKTNDDIKAFYIVGFGSGVGNSNKQIADAAGSKGIYYSAKDSNELQNLYNGFADKIQKTIPASLYIQEDVSLPQEAVEEYIKVKSLRDGFEFVNGKLTGELQTEYHMVENKSEYAAEPVTFDVEYVFEQEGVYILGKDGTSFAQMDVLDISLKKNFEKEIVIEVRKKEDMLNAPFIRLDVLDAQGIRYSSVNDDGTENAEIFDEEIRLDGNGVAQIEIKGINLMDAKYKFIKSDAKPQMPADRDMISISDAIVNENRYPDLLKDKEGYLTARSYDVSHLPVMNNTSIWNNRTEVFKNPSSIIEHRSATIAETVAEYTSKIDGSFINKTIFMDNLNVGGSGGPYPDYKEAAKFWGYITTPETGDYYFGTQSDDGSRGYIIVDDEKQNISEHFTIHGTQFNSSNMKMHLEKGEFYPIYLEYSNWGGWAEHRLLYKKSPFEPSSKGQGGENVPSSWFRPSLNMEPGELADSTFESSALQGIPFPEENGKYYIAIKAESESINNNIVTTKATEKIYGPFRVENGTVYEIFEHGRFEEGRISEVNSLTAPKGVKPEFGVELKFDGDSTEQDIIITFDSKITASEFELFNVADDGSLQKSAKEIKVCTTDNAPLNQQQINELLSKSNGPIELRLVLPEGEGNHFIIKYNVEHSMNNPGESLENKVRVNGGEPKGCIIRLAGSLKYT